MTDERDALLADLARALEALADHIERQPLHRGDLDLVERLRALRFRLATLTKFAEHSVWRGR